jgi:hypothetical protein
MAIGRISGQMLKSNLLRSGTDLAFETNLLVLDVSNSFVGIGTASPSRQLHISGTGALRVPSGDSSQRGTSANGDIRYNTDTGQIEGYAAGSWTAMTGGSTLSDTDGNTGISVERASDENEIHFFTEASGDVAHIRDNGNIELNNLKIADRTISSLTTNGDINITPNGTGQTVIKNLSVTDGLDLGDLNALNVGDINVDSVSSDNGTDFDLSLDDNSATALEIKEGSNAYMTFVTTNSSEQITVDKKMVVSTGITFETDTADINGGAIDGTTIGAASASTAVFTDLTANGTIDIDSTGTGNIDNVVIGANTAAAGTFTTATATNVEVTNIKANDGTASASIADSTGIMTIDSSVLTTTDINGGSVDGVTIGSNSAATALVANGGINIDDDGDGAMDGVVIGANTAAAGTFTTVTTTGNTTIGGNLTVNGTTTTIDSTTLTIEDPLIQLAKNNSGGAANAFDQGLFFNRGSLDNVSFLWDESADQFVVAVTSGEDGTTAGNVTIDSYANFKANVITAADVETGTISAADGTQSATIANSTGIMTIGSSVLTTTDINGGSIDGVTIGSNSAATALVANGGINIDDDGDGAIDGVVIGANTAAAGTFTNLTANGEINIDGDGSGDNIDGVIIGANTAAAGTFTTVTLTSNLDLGDQNLINGGDIDVDSISSSDGSIDILLDDNTAAALEIKEGANAYMTFVTTDSGEQITVDKKLVVTNGVTFETNTADINGGAIDGTTIGANSAAAGTFTTATATSVNATNVRANDGTAAIVITDSTGAVAVSTALTATGNVSVDGGTFTFNESGAAVDFRIEGNTDTDLFVVDGSADQIGISTAAGSIGYVLDASGSTDAFRLPIGNTSERPTAATGIIRYNSQTGKYEGCQDGSTYVEFSTAGDVPSISKVSATGDGSTQTFVGFFSSSPANANNVLVFIDNVYQEPTENYTVSGTNITFTSAPHSGARIFAIVGFDNTALASGGVARSSTSSVNFTSSATAIMSFNASNYRSAELYIQLTDSSNVEYSAMKGIVIHDGSTAYISIYGVTNTGGSDLATITAEHDGSNTVSVKAQSTGGQTAAIVHYSLAGV